MKKESNEGITFSKEKNFGDWYQQIITKSELAGYTKVSGAIVLRPSAMYIWEQIQRYVDKKFKSIGIQNVYFPLLIPESLLVREKEHVKGFSPEVAWVTQTGSSKLNERLAIRPTSEAIMYDSYSKWIRSWRDLPMRYNQWCNVIRWEFKNPVPLLRSREFLWNEGHTVFASEKEAWKERDIILKIYSDALKKVLALPGFVGKKSEKEKFAGAVATFTIEHILNNGKGIQGPDFHFDGQNFSRAYDIKFLDKDKKEKLPYQNTFAITTRELGVMVAIHSDDKGLVLPPAVAYNKLVIVPIFNDKTKKKVLSAAEKIKKELSSFNPLLDNREGYSPGWKFNEHELKGIPLRIEIGPKDIASRQVVAVKRNDGKKIKVKITQIKKQIPLILDNIHEELYLAAKKMMDSKVKKAETLRGLKKAIKDKKVCMSPICNSEACEESIKHDTEGAKILNIPLHQPVGIKNKKCIYCNNKANYWALIGKSY